MIVTCPEPGRLRAWLDGEAGGDSAPLADHVGSCPACRAGVGALARDAAVADAALDLLDAPAVDVDAAETERALTHFHRARPGAPGRGVAAVAANGLVERGRRPVRTASDAPIDPKAPRVPVESREPLESPASEDRRPVLVAATPAPPEARRRASGLPFRRWRLAAGGLAAALALTLLVATPEGQVAASGFLAQFRTQRFAVVTIDPSSGDRVGLQRLERLGTLTRSGPPRGRQDREVPSVEEASRRVGFAVMQADPSSLPTGVSRTPRVEVSPAGETRFTFDRDKAAAYFHDLGRADLRLPDKIHGTTLVVSMPPLAMLEYRAGDGKPAVMIGQASEVQVAVEGAASLDEVRDYLLTLPGFPAEVARQLGAIRDWRNTLPIPVPMDKIAWRETTIRGGQGLVLTDNTGLGSAALWRQPDGRIIGVAGPLKGDELQRVVDSIR